MRHFRQLDRQAIGNWSCEECCHLAPNQGENKISPHRPPGAQGSSPPAGGMPEKPKEVHLTDIPYERLCSLLERCSLEPHQVAARERLDHVVQKLLAHPLPDRDQWRAEVWAFLRHVCCCPTRAFALP